MTRSSRVCELHEASSTGRNGTFGVARKFTWLHKSVATVSYIMGTALF